MIHVKCYTDAAVDGNPGNGGVGIVVQGEEVYEQLNFPLDGQWDNHLAEFEAVFLALQWLIDHQYNNAFLFLHTDSKIVADSLNKSYAKRPTFNDYVQKIATLQDQFSLIEYRWIPESRNRGADNLARQALQKAIKSK